MATADVCNAVPSGSPGTGDTLTMPPPTWSVRTNATSLMDVDHKGMERNFGCANSNLNDYA
jgi:hypothetical protein